MTTINKLVLVCIVLTSLSANAEKFPPRASIAVALHPRWLGSLPPETQQKLLELGGTEVDPHAVPDILLDVLIQRSSLGGIIVPVTEVNVGEVQHKAEAIFAFFYRQDEAAHKEALRYWRARNRNSAVGLPIQWGAGAHAYTPVAALAVVALLYCWLQAWPANPSGI